MGTLWLPRTAASALCCWISSPARTAAGTLYLYRCESLGRGIVKRIAAVPGDRLRAEDGTLLINDEPAAPLPEEGVRPEYLTGGEFTVPEGSFFLLGDNLEHSIDSRYAEIGLAEERGMVGKVLT